MRRRRDPDVISAWFDNNMDIATRTIYMGSIFTDEQGESGVDNFMAEYFIKGMHVLEKTPDQEITIIMNNPGGDWYHGMAIYDAILNSPCRCVIKAYGYAMSMGSIILQAADHRIMMPNSRLMIHYGTSGLLGHSKIFEKWAEEEKKNNYRMENIYIDSILEKISKEGISKVSKSLSDTVNKARSTEIPKPREVAYKFSRSEKSRREEIRAVLKELLNFDCFLTAEETVSLGLADEVFKREK